MTPSTPDEVATSGAAVSDVAAGDLDLDLMILGPLEIAKRGDFLGDETEAIGERLTQENLGHVDEYVDDDEGRRHPGKAAVIMAFVTENQHRESPPPGVCENAEQA